MRKLQEQLWDFNAVAPGQSGKSTVVEITSQNHAFALDAETLPETMEVTHFNLNDRTIVGIRHKEYPAVRKVLELPDGG